MLLQLDNTFGQEGFGGESVYGRIGDKYGDGRRKAEIATDEAESFVERHYAMNMDG